ncbi:MAG: dockerin type I repeat-containing protein [Defluviitaleaceae bacterium]|nr:dockerin type I repeat-containing protein [Defluviitaleaceae bacterium]
MAFKWNGVHITELGIIASAETLPVLPEPRIITEEIPGRDGYLDFSTFNPAGRIHYRPREWRFLCSMDVHNLPNEYPSEMYKRGDVDGNGILTLGDATMLSRWLLGQDEDVVRGRPEHVWRQILDVNNDGKIDNDDVVHLGRALTGWSGYLPLAPIYAAPDDRFDLAINNIVKLFMSGNRRGRLEVDKCPGIWWDAIITNRFDLSLVARSLRQFSIYFQSQPFGRSINEADERLYVWKDAVHVP